MTSNDDNNAVQGNTEASATADAVNPVEQQYTSASTEDEVKKEQEYNPNFRRLDSVSEVSDLILNWHNEEMRQCNHVLNLKPEMVNDENGISIYARLHGEAEDVPFTQIPADQLDAYKLGISFALQHLGELPLKIIPTNADGDIVEEFKSVDSEHVDQAEETKDN